MQGLVARQQQVYHCECVSADNRRRCSMRSSAGHATSLQAGWHAPSSLKISSRLSSESFFPLRLFFPPFPAGRHAGGRRVAFKWAAAPSAASTASGGRILSVSLTCSGAGRCGKTTQVQSRAACSLWAPTFVLRHPLMLHRLSAFSWGVLEGVWRVRLRRLLPHCCWLLMG
jgi:hypothetical protein